MESHIILGVIQGLLEWIPISSEGAVALAGGYLLEGFNPVDVALFLHAGTLFAVLLYFRKDWINLASLKNVPLLKFLIIATSVSLLVAYPFYRIARQAGQTGFLLLFLTGAGLLFTAYFQKRDRKADLSSNKLALITGFLQGLAVIPGFSRSGATVFGLSLAKSDPEEILKISYMMSVPAAAASSLFLIFQESVLVLANWPALIFSFLAGFISLHFLIKISGRINFFRFALVFALLCFLGAFLGILEIV